jgi:hypothetical protein
MPTGVDLVLVVAASFFSAGSVFRYLLPEKIDLLKVIFKLPFFKDLTGDMHKSVEGIISGVIATIVWILFYYNYRIEPGMPSGFITLAGSIIGGPIMAVSWGCWELVRLHRRTPLSFRSWLSGNQETEDKLSYRWFLVIIVIMSLAGGSIGYTTGLTRPFENGMVISNLGGLEEERLKDSLQTSLEHLPLIVGSIPKPRSYAKEVSDTVSALNAARDSNRRFVVWGNVGISEEADGVQAFIFIRITDASQNTELFSPLNYEMRGTNRAEIMKRITDDLTLFSVWALGLAEATWDPTHESAVQASRILALLSSETIHKNVPEAKKLGSFLQDWGYEELYLRLYENAFSPQEMNQIFEEAISGVKALEYHGYELALARLYNYHSKATIWDDFATTESINVANDSLIEAINLDETYPMPHHNLALLNLLPERKDENTAFHHICEFFRKSEEAYGELMTDDRGPFQIYIGDARDWLIELGRDCDNET